MIDLSGKVALVTGTTTGIGGVTARELARMGATVVAHGRSPQKVEALVSEIRAQTGNPAVEGLVADLSRLDDVRRMAAEFTQRHDRLHILVNNAGAINFKRHLSADGFELTFAVNHLSHFLLTNLLLDTLKASAPARVVVLSSGAHVGGRINFDDLNLRRGFAGFKAYSQSKLANLLFAYELARRLDGTGVTVNGVHPGFVGTGFGKNNGSVFNGVFKLLERFSLSVEEGAQTSIYVASSPEVQGVSGKYFDNCRAVPSSKASYDEAAARRLWEVSAKMVSINP